MILVEKTALNAILLLFLIKKTGLYQIERLCFVMIYRSMQDLLKILALKNQTQIKKKVIMPTINDTRLYSAQCNLEPVIELHANEWFTVKNRGGYFTTEYSHLQVIVLPIVQSMGVVMVRPIRPIIADCPLELPAGGVNINETPVDAARRELSEETGIFVDDITRFEPLTPISNSPNRDPKLLHIFQVEITSEEFLRRGKWDKEIAGVECFSLHELKSLITSGDIYVSVPVAIIGRYLLSTQVV